METITKRQQLILYKFIESTNFLTSQELSNAITVSTKTIRNEIKILNYYLEKFALIKSVPARGYCLEISDNDLFEKFKNSLHNEWETFVPSTPLERTYYILGFMLKEEKHVKIDELSELLYIDRTSISRSMKYVRECLDSYGLEIVQQNKKGLKIIGNEFQYRQCMAEYLFHKPGMLMTDIGKNTLFVEELKDAIYNDGITMAERVFQNFIIHVQVQLNRILKEHYINFNILEEKEIENEYEHLVARDIAKIIEKYFHIQLSRNEIHYLTIHILGKRSNSTSAIESCINNQLKQEIDDVVLRMLNRVDDTFGIDLKDDMYLRKAIGIHINPMEKRLKFDTYLRNPLTYLIKEKYLFAYMMSLETWKVVANQTHYINIEDEIGYIAIHLQYAIERKKRTHLKKRVLLVNDYSVAMSELLTFSILRKYRDSLIIENCISISELNTFDILYYDFIITTVSISKPMSIPTIRISPVITNLELEKLEVYFENDNPNSLINYIKEEDICEISMESSDQIFEWIYKQENTTREEFYHTFPLKGFELNNQIAIHYIQSHNTESYMSIYVLNKPVVWKNKLVKVFFLIHIGIKCEKMVESLQNFISRRKNVDFITQEKSIKVIYKYIAELNQK